MVRENAMVYAHCLDTNILYCFRSEREAAEYCTCHDGDWQLCDEQGRALYPPGFAPQARVGLLAAHLWLADIHDDAGAQYTVHSVLGMLLHHQNLG
jgi:hypothetical protein